MTYEIVAATQLSVDIDQKTTLNTQLDRDILIGDTNLTQFSFHDINEGELCMRYDNFKYVFDINSNGELIVIFPEDQDFEINSNGELLQMLNE